MLFQVAITVNEAVEGVITWGYFDQSLGDF